MYEINGNKVISVSDFSKGDTVYIVEYTKNSNNEAEKPIKEDIVRIASSKHNILATVNAECNFYVSRDCHLPYLIGSGNAHNIRAFKTLEDAESDYYESYFKLKNKL